MNIPHNLLITSHRYRELLVDASPVLQESSTPPSRPPGNELTLQAQFYSGAFGDRWITLCGKEVQLLDPGEWNREAGPDFRGASVLLESGEKLRGDLEIDLQSSGWEQHSHATNPNFENVVLHLFFQEGGRRSFARTPSHRHVLQVKLGILPPERTAAEFGEAPIENGSAALELIALAAKYRLAQKANATGMLIQLHGRRNGLFQALASALGYRNNSIPLTLLAQRSGWKRATAADGESLLFGLSGFLGVTDFDQASKDTRVYLRTLWEQWWKIRENELRLVLPASAWKMVGSRPANHPHRRVGALHAIAGILDILWKTIEAKDPKLFTKHLTRLQHPFWNSHWNLRGEALSSPSCLALIGDTRAKDMLINIFAPLLASCGEDSSELLASINPGQIPGKVRELAAWLCPALPDAVLKSAATQQGLLQLGADFRGWESPRSLLARYSTQP